VAGGTHLPHEIEHGIAVAVERDLADVLDVAARVALAPERTAAARPVDAAALPRGGEERLAVRPGEHEDGAVLLLGDDGDEPAVVVVDPPEEPLDAGGHGRTWIPFARR
jgi:hypothetical protein